MSPADHEPPSSASGDPTIERWNRRYLDSLAEQTDPQDPHRFLTEHASLLSASGLALDVLCRDLERDELPAGPYDVIVNTLYLQRTLVPSIEQILVAGGLLFFATYLESGVAARAAPRFGLKPGELASLFPRLETLSYEEHDDIDRPWAGLAARKR